jgi:hypothetical protein
MEKEHEENKVNTDALQKELAALKHEQLHQHRQNKQLRNELVKLKVEREDYINNDLNYDSSENESDKENDINYDTECSNS